MTDGPIGDEHLLTRDSAGVDALAPATDRPAFPLTAPDGLDRHVRRDLRKQEQAIARQFMGGRMWPYVVAAWGGFALWVSLFPLTMLDLVPLWLAFIVSCVLATGGYVTSHEAMHSNIGRPGTRTRWINEWVGQVCGIL